jgi:hypothetical protein
MLLLSLFINFPDQRGLAKIFAIFHPSSSQTRFASPFGKSSKSDIFRLRGGSKKTPGQQFKAKGTCLKAFKDDSRDIVIPKKFERSVTTAFLLHTFPQPHSLRAVN